MKETSANIMIVELIVIANTFMLILLWIDHRKRHKHLRKRLEKLRSTGGKQTASPNAEANPEIGQAINLLCSQLEQVAVNQYHLMRFMDIPPGPSGYAECHRWNEALLQIQEDLKVAGSRIRVAIIDSSMQIGGAEWVAAQTALALDPQRFFPFFVTFDTADSSLCRHLENKGIHVLSAKAIFGDRMTFDCWARQKLTEMTLAAGAHTAFFPTHLLHQKVPRWQRKKLRAIVRISNFTKSVFDSLDFSDAHRIICCSDEQFVRATGNWPDKTEWIPTGVDCSLFHIPTDEEKQRQRKRLGIRRRHVVLFVGRLGAPLKQRWLLMHAIDEIESRRGDVVFLVVGYFERHRKGGEDEFQDFTRNRRIVWKNNVAPWEMPAYYQAADVLLSTSAREEGLSNTVLQALASGVVPVAGASSGMSDLIQDGENGFIVESSDARDFADSIEHILDQPKTVRSAMVVAGRKRAEQRFNIQNMVRRLEDLFVA